MPESGDGQLEAGESPAEALARELAEELGIGVRECRFWQSLEHSYAERGFRVRLHFFHVTAFSGEPCPAEGQNLRWVTPAEAPELGFLPADAGVLEQLRQRGRQWSECVRAEFFANGSTPEQIRFEIVPIPTLTRPTACRCCRHP